MQELATVRFFDSGTDPLEDIERPFHGQKFASVEFCTQRASRQQFHDDERMAAFDAEVVNSDHVLMEKARCRARFLMKSRSHVSFFNQVGPNDLNGNGT